MARWTVPRGRMRGSGAQLTSAGDTCALTGRSVSSGTRSVTDSLTVRWETMRKTVRFCHLPTSTTPALPRSSNALTRHAHPSLPLAMDAVIVGTTHEQLCRQQSTMSDSADRDCPAPEYFKCADQCRCLPVSKLCDKVKDCPDGSDEVQYMCSTIA